MILRSSPTSPFGRKIKIIAHILRVADRIEIVMTDTRNPQDSLRSQNPLGKIPALVLEDGTVLYDSRVIWEYLDHLAGGRLVPQGPERFTVLARAALCDGILDAAILQVYEKMWREEALQSSAWLEHQQGKVVRGLAALERELSHLNELTRIDAISAACALGYLDLRFGNVWRQNHPALGAWLDAFAARIPAYALTAPPTN